MFLRNMCITFIRIECSRDTFRQLTRRKTEKAWVRTLEALDRNKHDGDVCVFQSPDFKIPLSQVIGTYIIYKNIYIYI